MYVCMYVVVVYKKGNFLPTVAEGGRERKKKRRKRRRKRGKVMKGL